MTVSTQSYRPTLMSGKVYLRLAGSTDVMRQVGNCSALDLTIEEEEKDLTDHTQSGGGTWASVSRVTAVASSMTLHDLDRDNLALALYGTASQVPGANIATETHTARQGGLIPLAHPSPSAITITDDAGAHAVSTAFDAGSWVKVSTHLYEATTGGTTGASAPTWKTDGSATTDGGVTWADRGTFAAVGGTDYEVRPEGLMILGAGIPDGCPVDIAYTHAGYDSVHALTRAGATVEMRFAGLNEADEDRPVIVDLYRVKLSAASTLALIGEEFAELAIPGKLLSDPTKTGSGRSKYFDVKLV
jgi:hypothetical protein